MTAESRPSRKPLDDRPGFLLSQLGFYGAHRFAQRLAPLGLSPAHFGALTRLRRHGGKSQQQLADSMGVHRNAMVGLIDGLEERGLVERRPHPTDRRAHALRLTNEGRTVAAEADRLSDEHDIELLEPLSPIERDQLIILLQRVAKGAGLSPGVHPSGLRTGQVQSGLRREASS